MLLIQIMSLVFAGLAFIVLIWQLKVLTQQLRETSNTNTLQALTYIFNNLSTESSRRNRRYVQLELGNTMWSQLTEEQKLKVADVWGSFDQIAYLIEKWALPKKVVLDMWGPMIRACYLKSKDQLEQSREERIRELGKDGVLSRETARKYMIYFESLGKEVPP
jgi:hypothetical protein